MAWAEVRKRGARTALRPVALFGGRLAGARRMGAELRRLARAMGESRALADAIVT